MKIFFVVASICLLLTACGGSDNTDSNPEQLQLSSLPSNSVIPTRPSVLLPQVNSANVTSATVQKFDLLEMDVDISAEFTNPFDLRQINLMANFIGPNGEQMAIPGFWDAQGRWLIRFSPTSAGEWQYRITVQDAGGMSAPLVGDVVVADSDLHGWIVTGDQVDPNYSKRYLAHKDGTPFYGFGHGEAFAVEFRNDISRNIEFVVDAMKDANENYIVYWPYFYFSPVENNFDQFDAANLATMDDFIERFDSENLHMVYTLWDHNQLRDENHPWEFGAWMNTNGFSRLTSAVDFFTDAEAWEWQKNLYRYTIARWGYSSSIAMWQTVSEANGTNAGQNLDEWHERVNQYFVDNDPYRHPTTASLSGDQTWDRGHAAMDIPQVHIYQDLLVPFSDVEGLVIETAEVIADYTIDMWQLEEKPNWIGEFGVINVTTASSDYPELFHNALWAGLVSGAAMTPAEWNDANRWEIMTQDMRNHMRFLTEFMTDVPLVVWNPEPLSVSAEGQMFQAWGLTSDEGTIIWGLDTTHRGENIDVIRARRTLRSNVSLQLNGLAPGEYEVRPFDTWTGNNLPAYPFICSNDSQGCTLELPAFTSDIALKLHPL